LDNGEKIVIKDMLGHAEDIYWRWWIYDSMV